LLLVTVEDAEGLRNVEEIVGVPGLGGIIFGASDATMSKFGRMSQGIDYEWRNEADERVLRAARNVGLAVGTAPGPSTQAIDRAIEKGYTFIIGRGDNYLPLNVNDVRIPVPPERRTAVPLEAIVDDGA
jgi:2-keto-3-deoxy-L-rhamnonate aldolase RhmA